MPWLAQAWNNSNTDVLDGGRAHVLVGESRDQAVAESRSRWAHAVVWHCDDPDDSTEVAF